MDSTTSNRTAIVGVFDDKTEADRAVQALHAAGFKDEQIGYIRRNSDAAEGTTPIAEEHHTGAGIGTGALIGGLVGAAAALLIPGVGPVLAGGVLASTFGATVAGGAVVGAVGGAVAGGLIGALTDLGVPEDEARYADEQFQAGRTIVTVNAPGRAGEATEILRRYGAHDIQADRSGSYAPMATTSGSANVAPMTTSRSWADVMPTYRSRWQSQYGATGGRWEDVEPAYRFGYESSSMPTYKGRSWDQVEPNLRREWVARDPRTPWEKVKDAIRSAWDNTAA